MAVKRSAIYVISDSTGETGAKVVEAALLQFSRTTLWLVSATTSIGTRRSAWGLAFSFTTKCVTCRLSRSTITAVDSPIGPSVHSTLAFNGMLIIATSGFFGKAGYNSVQYITDVFCAHL